MQARNRKYWLLWLMGTLLLLAYFSLTLLTGNDKRIFMPGKLTSGHHQIGIACNACHGESFSDKNDFQKNCLKCHGDMRKKPFDSHPMAKFKDPRNIEYLKNIDALHCVSCHVEHQADRTHKGGYTQPKDFCVHCHANIAEERPSHKGMDFMSCNNAGCHNFHDNRALYTDFLIKHLNEPALLETKQLPKKDYAERLDELANYPHDRYPVKALTKQDADAPKEHLSDNKLINDWLLTRHARSGVTCNACHMTSPENGDASTWTDHPNQQQCKQCHDMEVKNFQEGKHGMRLKVGLPAMKVRNARLAMKADKQADAVSCVSCHAAHRFDVKKAAVDACLACHNDQHSLAYQDSPHASLWKKELTGELPKNSGVSCASCHMPRMDMDVNDWMSRTVVMHNQNATLIPNEKMIRPVCLHCHGLEFSINALADDALVQRNFKGQPRFKTKSMQLADDDQKRHKGQGE